MAMEDDTGLQLREYSAILRRHKGQVLAVTAILAAVTVAVAIGLPPVYRSSATILVQEQEVPPDLVRSTITSFADERIGVISQQVMTRAVLLQLADKYGLYEKERGRVTNDEIVERMRKDIKLTTVDASISDRSSGRRVNATIAFKISYDSRFPDRAQKVVNDVVTFYLEENLKARQQSVAETTAFLGQEADRLARQIQEIESGLAEFKRRNVGRTPESSAVNMQLAERTQSDLQRVERDLSMVQERRLSLEAQLPLVSRSAPATAPGTPVDRNLSQGDRLRALQAQYTSASAVYGPDHPDIRRLQREIAALRAESGATGRTGEGAERIKSLEAELAALKDRYADDHPDVQRVRRSIAALKASEAREATAQSDNPAYVALVTQIESAKREYIQLTAQRDDLRAKQRIYDSRLLQIPEIEREYRDLTRDYENAQKRYSEIKAKQLQAEGAQELEKERKAERFSLGEPPNVPERPSSPNRLAILLGGLAASLAAGIGLAVLRDAMNPAVKGPWQVARLAGAIPILTAIPYIETRGERAGNRTLAMRVGGTISVFAVALAFGIYTFLKMKFW